MTLLQAKNLTTFYGASQALFGVDLTISEGEVVALMGRNGMGKTTTIATICRMLKHREGTLEFAGQNLGQLPSHKAARLGIGLVPEGRRCFPNLTVGENLIATARPGDWTLETVGKFFPRLAERHGQMASTLSGGEQQMLAIARALMTNPKLLILDEATEGLAPVVRQEIWQAIHRLKSETGMAILVVDKTLKELRQVADRAVILEKGRTVWDGKMGDLTHDLTDQYLGV